MNSPFLIITIFVFSFTACFSQELKNNITPNNGFLGKVGIGISKYQSISEFSKSCGNYDHRESNCASYSQSMDVSRIINKNIWAISYIGMFSTFGGSAGKINEVSFLWGKYKTIRNFFIASFGCGFSYVGGIQETDYIRKGYYNTKEFHSIGLPVQVSGILIIYKYVGIGVKLFGNLNPNTQIFYGGLVGIYIGTLKLSKIPKKQI